MTGVVVTTVENGRDERAFLDLPYRLHATDPNWVAPLRSMERDRWRPGKSASLDGRKVRRFLALRAGRTVGRIAAILDPEFGDRWGPTTAFFGFYECTPDAVAAAALFAAAEGAARDWGARTMMGPVNLTTNDEVGFLVEGFDSPPRILSPYNPHHYVGQVESAGYGGDREYLAFLWTPDIEISRAAERIVRRAAARQDADGVRVRGLDPTRWDEEVRTLHTLYNESFAGVWGFVPMTWKEFEERARSFRDFYRPDLIVVAEERGEAVGFGVVLPDVNAALRPLRGRMLPLGWLRLLRRVRRLDTGRLLLMGVRPEHAGRGIAVLISDALSRRSAAAGFRDVELSLVQADNRRMVRVIEAFGCDPVKRYRLYRKSLSGP